MGVSVAIFACYQALIFGHAIPASDGNSQWEDNLIRAQDYACGSSTVPSLALVGTSLAANLKADYFGPGTVNLGMAGGSVQTGLALVVRAPHKPRTLLVEMDDKVAAPSDAKTLGAVFGPLGQISCHALPALRVEYRPASVVISTLKRWTKRRSGLSDEARDAAEPIDQNLRRQLVSQELAAQAVPLSREQEAALQAGAQTVRARASRLQRDGVRVVLFEPPGEAAVQASPRQRQVRLLLHRLFPSGPYQWLPAPSGQDWTTRDGVHLIRRDARRYAAYVQAWLRRSPGADRAADAIDSPRSGRLQ